MDVSFGGSLGMAAYEHVRELLHPAILAHSIRVWLIADSAVGRQSALAAQEREALAVACLFHDAGTSSVYDGPQRFEVEGADAAAGFLAKRDVDPDLRRQVWEAIALHTSPGIAERMGPLTRFVRLGVMADFGSSTGVVPEDLRAALEQFPRADIEIVLGDAVVAQAVRRPRKAPAASWPGALLAAHFADPSHRGVNKAF
ncbi:HD domain-containing protein [Streptomyces sp. NPDC046870]|uniref:HD domain-containing protein n=1 Tax=Streptomyces sp. NPDC046870 TaxID=3155135 RepID=UPI0034569A47